ncbi:hypothetical protein CE91St44_16560 [Oscillospiraceae bacterium]|nr:hypothetical protein CE91St44_16560 [Oscillospiraceae bacterium]
MTTDYTLYLVTDRSLMSTETLGEAVEQAILGGCTMVQLREKDSSSLDFYQLARGIKKITDRFHIPLMINDRIDIALAVDAAGVPFPVSWTVKMKKKQKETQDILSYHTQAAGCSDKARAKASGGRQPIEECGRTGL